MTIATAAKLELHPPLARDAAGNLLPVPAGTSSFCLGRETPGRPRLLRGPDKQLWRFPQHTSPEDVLDLCGPGVYRVYALDALGEQLGDEHVARWDLTSSSARDLLRNASIHPMIALRPERTGSLAGAATDLRFALETMAQMMRTNSDALRLVAQSQVDLAKTIASVKGLPRNAAMYVPPTAPTAPVHATNDDGEEDDEIDEQSQQAAPTNAFDLLMPFSEALAEKVADVVPNLAPGLFGGASANGTPADSVNTAASAPTAAEDDIANRPFEARELVDLEYAHRKGEAKRAASRKRAAKSVTLQARIMKDPQLFRQVTAIKKLLTPDEINTLLSAAQTWSEAAATKFLDTIKPLAVSDAVVYCREVIKTVLAHQANANGNEHAEQRQSTPDGAA